MTRRFRDAAAMTAALFACAAAGASAEPVEAGYAGAFTCFRGSCTTNAISVTAADAENAAQVDASARIAHRVGSGGELPYGLRYINYAARYGATWQLADPNVGIAPVLGYRVRL